MINSRVVQTNNYSLVADFTEDEARNRYIQVSICREKTDATPISSDQVDIKCLTKTGREVKCAKMNRKHFVEIGQGCSKTACAMFLVNDSNPDSIEKVEFRFRDSSHELRLGKFIRAF